MSETNFVEQLKKLCQNQPGIVVYVGPDGEDEFVIIDSTLHDAIREKLVKKMHTYMQSNFETFFDEAIDEWRHQNNAKNKKTE